MASAPTAPKAPERRAWLVPALAIFGVTALGFALRPLWQGAQTPTPASGSTLAVEAAPPGATSSTVLPAVPTVPAEPSAGRPLD